jgi:hypothetical protein
VLVHHPMAAFLLLAAVGACAVPLLSRLGPVLAASRHQPVGAASESIAAVG